MERKEKPKTSTKEPFKRGDTWYIRYELPPKPDGSRGQKMEACLGMTKKQAQDKLDEIKRQIRLGIYVDTPVIRFSDYLKEWAEYKRPRLAEKTWERYEEMINNNIIPFIGHYQLDAIRAIHLETFYSKLLTSGRKNGTGGLSAKTIKNIHGIIHCALEQAVKWQYLYRNPATMLELPRYIRPEAKSATEEQVYKVLDAFEGTIYEIPVLLMLGTGMRRGEVCALRWEDFDAGRRLLVVRHSLSQTKQGVKMKETKTGKRRVVKLPEEIVTKLLAHEKVQEAWKKEYAGKYHDAGFICTNEYGRYIDPHYLTEKFRRTVGHLGIDVTPKNLRHTQATLLMGEANIPAKIVQERLGHSTITTTMDIYSHVQPHMQDAAADYMNELLRKRQKKQDD